ncbi:glucan 1,4-alpha-glucosidase [Aureimonas endophytica]|uniref:glucan 1,4-alpha-glucosidase n=1 Tax=Aureimonas endophytica TaxID=2027858 RepID=A0A916ZMH0_9HYPH|nr:glycoside hydrolase family 15 protein [Aureimonas endophytica]GGE04525.1 glucan 1,4-alpha-glucosidase [Aureimonas endophytica]
MTDTDTDLDGWIAGQAEIAATAMLRAISATDLVKHRPGFGQTVVPLPGSVLASPVPASYDPDPDYFFHWYRDSAIVIDALRVARIEDLVGDVAETRLREFVEFTLSLDRMDRDGRPAHARFRQGTTPDFLRFVRDEAEIGRWTADWVRGETRVNPDATPDFTRWDRPQADGVALRAIALLRWPNGADEGLRTGLRAVIEADLAFTLAHGREPSFDIWEEELGHHYYTTLVQAEALGLGAAWFAELDRPVEARACAVGADELASRLGEFWDGRLGFIRSRRGVSGGSERKALDAATLLAVIHAGRASGPHSILDPRVQAGVTALESLFETAYAINRDRPADRGPALGRYAGDAYYSGGAYYFSTLAAAEFYYRLSAALRDGADLPAAAENGRFRERLPAGRDRPASAAAALRQGDAIMATVRAYTPASGAMSEQFDQGTGEQTSARHLTWSYAAFITAAAARSAATGRRRA